MKKQALPLKVKQLKKMYENGTITFDNPIQRRSEMWNNYKKSLLINSMLDDYIVPPIYFIKEDSGKVDTKGRTISNYDVIDGKQRLLNVFGFMNGDYALHKDTPELTTEDWDVDIAGKTFFELDQDLQENISNFTFQIYNLEGNSDEEIEEFFLRINGGENLSKNQITKGKLGIKMAEYVTQFLDGKFFSVACNFSGAQYKAEVDLCTLLQCLMMLEVNAGRYELSSFSENDVQKFAETIHDELNVDTKERFEKDIDFLNEAFSSNSKEKWLRKTHIPMVFLTADYVINDCEKEIDAITFYKWYLNFAESYSPDCEYAEYCGAGSVKKPKIYGRIETMLKDFKEFIGIVDAEPEESEEDNTEDNTHDVEETEFCDNTEESEIEISENDLNVAVEEAVTEEFMNAPEESEEEDEELPFC